MRFMEIQIRSAITYKTIGQSELIVMKIISCCDLEQTTLDDEFPYLLK